MFPCWSAKYHLTCGNATPPPPCTPKMIPWPAAPAKIKIAHAALIPFLNMDVDPPDITKTNSKISYKSILDPSRDDLKRFCGTLRMFALEDAVLFHYDGHGVPKPTPVGSCGVSTGTTRSIPIALREIQTRLPPQCIFI